MIKLLCLILVVLSSQSFAVNINIKAFKEKGLIEAGKLFGSDIAIEKGPLLFKDGAWFNSVIDPTKCEDYAAFYFKILVDHKLLPPDVDLAYELNLSDGKARFVFIPRNSDLEYVALINQEIIEFKEDAGEDEIKQFIQKISTFYPATFLRYLSSFRILFYEASSFNEALAIQMESKSSKLVNRTYLNKVNYKMDFKFDPVVFITEVGIIDASKYRGFTKQLKDWGCQFATETTVPIDLQD